MALEDVLKGLTEALDRNTAALIASAKATVADASATNAATSAKNAETSAKNAETKAKAEPPKEEKKKPKYTLDEVREAFRAYGKLNGKEEALKVLAKYGDTVNTIDPDKYDEVMKDLDSEKA